MAKYSKGAQKSVATAMKRMEKGKLESGRSGKKVTDPKQAIAIGLSEAKKKGAKVPAKKSAPGKTAKKVAKSAPAKKSSPAKAVKKQTKASPPKKTSTKNAPAKKSAAKKNDRAKKVAPSANQSKRSLKQSPSQQKKGSVKKSASSRAAIPPPPEDTVVLAQQAINANLPPVEEKSTTIAVKAEDPLLAEDRHEMMKATTKSDPKRKVRQSSAKTSIKPSGKKPLWN